MDYSRAVIFFGIILILSTKATDAQPYFDHVPFLRYWEDEGTVTIDIEGTENDVVSMAVQHWTTEDDDFDTVPNPAITTTIPASGSTSIDFVIEDESVLEQDEHFILYLLDGDGVVLDWLLVYILNDDARVEFTGNSREVFDEGTPYCATLERIGYVESVIEIDPDIDFITAEGGDVSFNNDDIDFGSSQRFEYHCFGSVGFDRSVEDLEYFEIELDRIDSSWSNGQLTVGDDFTYRIYDRTLSFSFVTDNVYYLEGDVVQVGIRRSGSLDIQASVIIAYERGTALFRDFDTLSRRRRRLFFPPGVEEIYFSVAYLYDDDVIEDIEDFYVILESTRRFIEVIGEPDVVKVLIGDRTTEFTLTESTIFIQEGDDLYVTIERKGYLEDTASVDTYYFAGTANEDDVEDNFGRKNFAEGQTTARRNLVDINTDDDCEDIEYFTICLDDPSSTGGERIGQACVRVYIYDQTVKTYFADRTIVVHEGDSVFAQVNREGRLWDSVTVDIDSNAGTATTADYTITPPVTVQFNAGVTSTLVEVVGIDTDEVCEDLEYFTIELDDPSDGGVVAGGPTYMNVFIVDTTTIFSLVNEVYFITEGETFFVHIRRQGYIQQDGDVSFTITDGTADDDTDAGSRASPADLDFDDQEKVLSHEIFDIILDDVCEDVEYFDIEITNPNLGYIGSPNLARVYIYDSTPQIYIEEARYHVEEGESVTIRIRRSGNLRLTNTIDLQVTDDMATGGGVDYIDLTAIQLTVTFNPGDEYYDRTFATIRDAILEDTETFTVELVTPRDDPFAIKSPSLTTIFIEDRTTTYSIEEFQYWIRGGTNLVVTFHREGYLGQEDTITLSSTEDSALTPEDYSLPTDVVITFPIGAITATKTITTSRRHIPSYVERGLERFFISIAIDADDTSSVLKSPSTAEVFIYEIVTNYMFEVAYEVVPESTGDWTIYISRDGPISQPGSVVLNTRDLQLRGAKEGIDYEPIASRQIDFLAFESQVETTLTILADELVEGLEQFEIYLSNPDGPPLTTNDLGPFHVTIIDIADDDGFFRFSTGLYLVEEANETVHITVERHGYMDVETAVVVRTADQDAQTLVSPFDYTAVVESLIFESCQNESSFTVPILNDGHPEGGGELFRIDLFIDGHSQVFAHTFTYVYIQDDDVWYRFSKDFYSVNEVDRRVSITIERFGSLRIPTSVTARTKNQKAIAPLDYTEVEQRIVFATEDRSHSYDIPINDEETVESAENFRIDLFIDSSTPHTCTYVQIEDNDVTYSFAETSHSVEESERKVTLTVLRHGFLGNSSSVGIVTSDLGATRTEDYANIPANSGRVSFSPDQMQTTFDIDIVDDGVNELTEEFRVQLQSSVPEELRAPATAIVTILNDDAECSQVCQNGGMCMGIDKCSCPEEFTGTLCQTDVNECELINTQACSDELSCVNTFGGYECRCNGPGLFRLGNQCIPVREVSGQITIVEIGGGPAVYGPSLGDPTSEESIELALMLDNVLINSLEDLGIEVFDVRIVGFFPGSIVAQYIVTLRESSRVTAEELNSRLRAEIIRNDGFISGSDVKTVDNILGVDLCDFTVCKNGGTCIFENDLDASCICPYGFEGDFCEIQIPEPTQVSPTGLSWIAILGVIFGVVIFFLIIFFIITVAYWRNRKRDKPTESTPISFALNRPQILADPNFLSTLEPGTVNMPDGSAAGSLAYYVTGENNNSIIAMSSMGQPDGINLYDDTVQTLF